MKALDLASSKQTMSSLEIADLTGKAHDKVRIDIERILSEAQIGVADFRGTYRSKQGKALPCFNLPRRECDLVISGYSVKYRLKIIDRWQELEKSNPKLPVNYIEALTALIESEKEKEIEKRKVAALSTIVDNEFGYSSILRAAKHIGVHENNFNWRPLKNQTLAMGLEVKKVPSPRFEYQNLYPLRAFEFCYPEYDFTELTPQKIIDEVVEI